MYYGPHTIEYLCGTVVPTLGVGDGRTRFALIADKDSVIIPILYVDEALEVGTDTKGIIKPKAFERGVLFQLRFDKVSAIETLEATLRKAKLKLKLINGER